MTNAPEDKWSQLALQALQKGDEEQECSQGWPPLLPCSPPSRAVNLLVLQVPTQDFHTPLSRMSLPPSSQENSCLLTVSERKAHI